MKTYTLSEVDEIIKRAKKLFPDEAIFYNLAGTQTIDEYTEELEQRIKEAEEAAKR